MNEPNRPARFSDGEIIMLKEQVDKLEQDFRAFQKQNTVYLKTCDGRFQDVQKELKELRTKTEGSTSTVAEIEKNTKEILTIVNSFEGFFRVTGWLQKGLWSLIKWGSLIGICWAAITQILTKT